MLSNGLSYASAEEYRRESFSCFLEALDVLGLPRTMIDLGCGDGYLVGKANSFGIVAMGVDIGLKKETPQLWRRDLTQVFALPTVDLVLCWEVAEHLINADALIQMIHQCVRKTVLFTAAPPGQGGQGHINEQPQEYWRERLAPLHYNTVLTKRLASRFLIAAPRAPWYGRNLQVFQC